MLVLASNGACKPIRPCRTVRYGSDYAIGGFKASRLGAAVRASLAVGASTSGPIEREVGKLARRHRSNVGVQKRVGEPGLLAPSCAFVAACHETAQGREYPHR
jgi:hypothetical protein